MELGHFVRLFSLHLVPLSPTFQVFEKCSVTNVLSEGHTFNTKRVTGVQTKYGMIKTKCVVNCTGAWANDITNMLRS